MNPVLLIIGGGIISVIIVVCFAIYFYIQRIRKELAQQAKAVDVLLLHRLNLLPYLVETMRVYQSSFPEVQKMVTVRGELLTTHDLTPERWQKEKVITETIDALFEQEKKVTQLTHDLHYLEVKKELKSLAEDLNKGLNTYNATVEIFHHLAKKLPLRPIPSFIGHTR